MNYFINQRVKEFIETREIKPIDFAKEIGLNSDRVSKWFRMKEKIPAEHVIIIIEKYKDIDARWLLTGEASAPARAKPYKNDTELDVVNNRGDYCKLCREKDKLIDELREDKAWLKKQVEDKKETGFADSAQIG